MAITQSPLKKEEQEGVILTLNQFYKKELETEKIKWKLSTIQDQKRTLNKLNVFDGQITPDKLENLPEDFEVHLLASGNMARNSTIPKHQKNLRKYLIRYIKYCIKHELIKPDFNPYENYSIGRIKGNRQDLTLEEVQKIENIEDNKLNKLQHIVRDKFLFSCYTGLRISDNYNLHTGFLQVSDISGISIEMNRMIKVDYELNLELRYIFEGKAEKIILKYISIDEILQAQKLGKQLFVFPPIPDQKVNDNLKTIAYHAGINKKLTFHVARHTCGTNLADAGADIDLIMELMGIRKYDTARIYIHRSKERRRTKLNNLNWNLLNAEQNENQNQQTDTET